jgi:hypothetical protein
MRRHRLLLPLVLLFAAPAARADEVDARGASGILADLRRIVGAEEASGWFVDETHLAGLLPTMLQTVCRATPEARREALRRVEAERRQAGDPRELFTRAGDKLDDDASRALTLDRQQALLARTIQSVEGSCPFWVRPEPGFDGRQTDANRWGINLESGGLLQLRHTAGSWTYGGGGVGRLLVSYGFRGVFSVLGGLELAGGAMLRPDSGTSGFVINYLPALPLVLRLHDGSLHYDLEVAGVSIFQADNTHPSFGGRLGLGFGVSALRTRFFIPWAGFGIAYEHYLEGGERPAQDFLRAGLRVGAVWNP